MILEGFDLFVEDMGTMIRFYRDVLGFAITEPESAVNVSEQRRGSVHAL